jgi:hypothetical protein
MGTYSSQPSRPRGLLRIETAAWWSGTERPERRSSRSMCEGVGEALNQQREWLGAQEQENRLQEERAETPEQRDWP